MGFGLLIPSLFCIYIALFEGRSHIEVFKSKLKDEP